MALKSMLILFMLPVERREDKGTDSAHPVESNNQIQLFPCVDINKNKDEWSFTQSATNDEEHCGLIFK